MIYKGLKEIKNVTSNTSFLEIYTGMDGGLCGTYFPLQQEYLIAGTMITDGDWVGDGDRNTHHRECCSVLDQTTIFITVLITVCTVKHCHVRNYK
jgi:hypothetical protein